MIVSPLFWEWLKIWLIQFVKNLCHEINMVAIRSGNSSLSSVSHGCGIHGGQQNALDLTHRLQTSLGMQRSASSQTLGHPSHASHLNHTNHVNHANHSNHISHANHSGQGGNPLSIPPLSSVSLFMQQQTPANLKHEQNTRYTNSNCMLPSHHYRLLSQTRPDCYHPSGTAGGTFMTAASNPQSSGQSMRGQPAPQPSAPPAPPQDISKTTMAGPSYVTPQNQTPPSRPQYQNFSYRGSQHGNRPTNHPRQQQPYIGANGTTATGAVMYHPLVFPPHMGIPQTYQQPRSTTPGKSQFMDHGYYQYVGPYISYTTPAGHTPPYFFSSNGQQMGGSTVGGTGRGTTGALVPQQPPAPSAPNALSHQQTQPHIHPAITGIRQAQPPPKRTSHRLAIINPITQQDIFSEISSSDSQYASGESSGRQTPQPESTHSAVEEFARRVSEVANQPSTSASKFNHVSKNVDVPATTTNSNNQPQTKAINTINSNILKSDIINDNESKTLGSEIIEINETPIVSAISDSPVVVPKMTINVKQTQKNMDQPLVIDSKNLTNNKKENKNKPVVPQDETEKQSRNVEFIIPQTTNEQMVVTAACVQSSAIIASPVNVSISSSTVTPVVHSQTLPAPAPAPELVPVQVPVPVSLTLPKSIPQPQRVREPRERLRSEEKDINPGPKAVVQDITQLHNGPTKVDVSSVDSLLDTINHPTSQVTENQETNQETKVINHLFTTHETEISFAQNPEVVNCRESRLPVKSIPTATELLSASIEKVAKEQLLSEESFNKEESIAIQAQAKLTQSIASVARNHPEPMMKDLNNSKPSDPDNSNGNSTEVNKTETGKDNVPKNEKSIKNSKNSNKKSSKQAVANNEANKSELHENGKDETDKVSKEEQDQNLPQEEQTAAVEPAPGSTVFVPKYKYSDDQWSPLNKSGKKYYDIGLLMQIKDDPQSKNKPNAPLLDTCNVIKAPVPEMMNFNPFLRPVNDALFPNFLKNAGAIRSNSPRDPKGKDGGRIMTPGGKGSVKLPSSSNSSHKNVIHVSLSLREDVKLNQTKDAWKPTRFKKDNLTEEEYKTQDLYKKFRGILNKLTPQKFDTLLDRVKTLEINTQARLEGVIDLVFEKAIDEPNFSEAYAAMCSKLSMLKVPANNAPEQCVNFRALIISKCQNQFITDKVDENILKLEKELADCTDPAKKRELHLMLEEENRRVRMRSVGNVRFIGELYKLKMLTSKIMVYCMTYLIEKLEEEKLECLCKLLTTIGEQVESEVKEQLESVFKKMQDIVDRKSNKISSRVRFMLQDVIELKRRKWVAKNVVDSQPKMMDQIQKEAEQQQRHIELMNSNPMGGGGGGFRREEGGRGKRGGERRQGPNSFMDNQWKMPRTPNYTVDTSKLKAVTQKNLNNIKLAPHNSGWNYGSGTKTPAQTSSTSMISISKNMYSVLENVQTDPTSLRTNKDLNPSYQHSKSIERSTFNSRGDFNNGSGSRSGSIGVSRSNSSSRNSNAPATPAPDTTPAAPVPQEPLPDFKKKSVKTLIMENLANPNDESLLADFTQAFPVQYHAAVVTEILNVALEKSVKEINAIIKALLLLVSTGNIAGENFVAGMNEILEFAPDLYIDIPMLYEYLGKFIAPHIEKKHITFVQTYRLCDNIITANHGHKLLKSIIKDLKDSMGQFFVKTKWQESGLELKQWMSEEQVPKWIEENKFEFLEGGDSSEVSKKILTPNETQSKLLQLMNADENCDCIRGWVQDNLGVSSNEDWFMRALIQAICEHALYGSEGRDVPHFSHERINKYVSLINDFGESRDQREASCLFGIQQLIHRLVHPQGLTLEIFQYLHEQYIISVEGFIAWEDSEKEPEGKAVMLKALTSFFTNIREADNEESCSED